MAYGDSQANTFKLSGRFIQPQQAQSQEQGVEYGGMSPLDDPNHPLAQRDKMLSDLYDTYSSLDAYAKEAAKKGIDVFEPDFSQRGGGEAHRTFQMLQGALMKQANGLRNEYEKEKQISPLVAQGKVRFNKGTDMQGLAYSDPNNYYSTEPLENVNEANVRGRASTYTKADQNRVNAELQAEMDQIDNDPSLSPEAKELQKSYIVKNARETHPSYFKDDSGSGKGIDAKSLMPLYERITNLTRGVFPKSEVKEVIHNGKLYSGSSSLAGDNFGEIQVKKEDSNGNTIWVKQPRTIKNILKDKQGNTYLQFDGESQLMNVSDKPSDEVMRTIVESNSSKYGGANALPMFYNELSKKGILGNDRSVDSNLVFGKDLDKQEVETRPANREMEKKLTRLKPQFDELVSGKDSANTVETRKGKFIFERDDDKGVVLQNWKELGFEKPVTNINYAKYIKLIEDAGFFDALQANIKGDTKGYTPTQSKAIDAFTKKFGRKPTSSEEQKLLVKFK